MTPTRVAPAPAPTGAIDPRIRERRAAVLRSQARRRLWAVGAVAVLMGLGAGGWALLHTRLFSARVVTVTGATHTPVAEVVAAAGLAQHPPLIDVGSAAVAGIERLPWVKSATVTRRWPDGVEVHVTERTVVASVPPPAPGGAYALVDGTGRVLEDTASPPSGLLEVTGPKAPGRPGSTLTSLHGALGVATSLPAAFRAQVTEVAIDASGTVTLHLTSPLTVDLGTTLDLHQKFEDVAAILAGAPLQAGDVIDVAAPDAPFVSP